MLVILVMMVMLMFEIIEINFVGFEFLCYINIFFSLINLYGGCGYVIENVLFFLYLVFVILVI